MWRSRSWWGLRTLGATSFHVLSGPFLGLLVRCRVIGAAIVGTMGCDEPLAGIDRKALDAGVAFGFGVGRGIGQHRVSVDIQTALALTDSKDRSLPPGNAENVSAYLTIGVFRPLNRGKEAGQ